MERETNPLKMDTTSTWARKMSGKESAREGDQGLLPGDIPHKILK